MGTSERRKGAEYEREIAQRWGQVLGVAARRVALLQAADGSASPDVECEGFWIEAKRRKRLSVMRWLEKTAAELRQQSGFDPARRADSVPIVAMREDSGASAILVYLEDLPLLVAKLSTSPAVLRLIQSGGL